MEKLLRNIKKLVPSNIFRVLQPLYHFTLAFLAAVYYRFPSRHIRVVMITGTKGKTSTTEIVNSILEEAGLRTALSGTLRFKIGESDEQNFFKMTTPGRFFVQRFLRRAVNAKCDWAVIEMTSEGAKQFRHKFIDTDALIFTNLSPEHIEAHGSFEKYLDAKVSIARALGRSSKRPRIIVANKDSEYADKFLAVPAEEKLTYSTETARPYILKKYSTTFNFMGAPLQAKLSGLFNLSNLLAGITFARAIGISPKIIRRAVEKFPGVRGRVERVSAGQNFDVIVDYAHTRDSLEKVYEVFSDTRKICVFGCAGGGRDKWKRPEMGAIAASSCAEIILTTQDPYDEDPDKIVSEIVAGMGEVEPTIIMDRRAAIAHALSLATEGDTIIITGKGSDPYIMGPKGSRTPWDEVAVVTEELKKLGYPLPSH